MVALKTTRGIVLPAYITVTWLIGYTTSIRNGTAGATPVATLSTDTGDVIYLNNHNIKY